MASGSPLCVRTVLAPLAVHSRFACLPRPGQAQLDRELSESEPQGGESSGRVQCPNICRSPQTERRGLSRAMGHAGFMCRARPANSTRPIGRLHGLWGLPEPFLFGLPASGRGACPNPSAPFAVGCGLGAIFAGRLPVRVFLAGPWCSGAQLGWCAASAARGSGPVPDRDVPGLSRLKGRRRLGS